MQLQESIIKSAEEEPSLRVTAMQTPRPLCYWDYRICSPHTFSLARKNCHEEHLVPALLTDRHSATPRKTGGGLFVKRGHKRSCEAPAGHLSRTGSGQQNKIKFPRNKLLGCLWNRSSAETGWGSALPLSFPPAPDVFQVKHNFMQHVRMIVQTRIVWASGKHSGLLHYGGSSNHPVLKEQTDTKTWHLNELDSPIFHFWQYFYLGFPAELLQNIGVWFFFPGVGELLSSFSQHLCTHRALGKKTRPCSSACQDCTHILWNMK